MSIKSLYTIYLNSFSNADTCIRLSINIKIHPGKKNSMSSSTGTSCDTASSTQRQVSADSAEAQEIAQMLNMDTFPKCTQTSVGAGSSLLFGMFSLGANAGGSNGCETVSKIINTVYNTQQNVVCLLKTTQSSTTTTTSALQNITITNGKTGKIACQNGLLVSNIANLDVQFNSTLDSKTEDQIASQLSSAANNVVKLSQDAYTAAGSPPTGEQALNAAITKNKLLNDNKSIQEIVRNVYHKVGGKQDITITNYGIIESSECKITNELILKLIANEMITTTFGQIFDLNAQSKSVNESTTTQKSETGGVNQSSYSWQSIVGGVLGLVTVLLIIGAVIYVYNKASSGHSSKGQSTSASSSTGTPTGSGGTPTGSASTPTGSGSRSKSTAGTKT